MTNGKAKRHLKLNANALYYSIRNAILICKPVVSKPLRFRHKGIEEALLKIIAMRLPIDC